MNPATRPITRGSTYVSMPGIVPARIATYPKSKHKQGLAIVYSGPTYADFFLQESNQHAIA